MQELIHTQQFFHWQHWRGNRLKAIKPHGEVQQTGQ